MSNPFSGAVEQLLRESSGSIPYNLPEESIYLESVRGLRSELDNIVAGVPGFVIDPATIDHDLLLNFNQNEHYLQSAIVEVGTLATGTWEADVITEVFGGTGQSSYTLGDVLYSDGADSIAKLAGNTVATKKFLTQIGDGAISAAPAWNIIVDGDIAESNVTQHETALTILESQITDGSLLARLADTETISGLWTFSDVLTISTSGKAIDLTGSGGFRRIHWGQEGAVVPTFNSLSAGVKLVLWDLVDATRAGYSIGMATSTMWFGVSTTSARFEWYHGIGLAMKLTDTALEAAGITLGTVSDPWGNAFVGALTTNGLVTLNGGNVLIGTTTDLGANKRLQVSENGIARVVVIDTSAGAGNAGILFRENAADRWAIASVGSDLIFFEEGGGGTQLKISAGGVADFQGNAVSMGALTLSGALDMGTNNITNAGTITATTLIGALTGNASTATALQTPRDINGTSFDGTANITITAAAGTLTGTTLNSTVVSSSLTSVGTIVTGVWSGTAVVWTKVNKTGSVLADIDNVTITSIASGEILKWNGSLWINNTLAEAGISATSHNHTLDSLSNVTITSIASGELLKWSGSAWINNTLAEAGISATGHTHTKSDITDTPWDHGSDITGLGDDDHTQYLLVGGSRAMSGNLDMGTNNITNAGTYSGGAITATADITQIDDGSIADIIAESYRASAATHARFFGKAARGTSSSPSPILSGDNISQLTAMAYHSGGAFGGEAGIMRFTAAENHTVSAQGVNFEVHLIPIGSNTISKVFTISAGGAADFQSNAVSMGALTATTIAGTTATFTGTTTFNTITYTWPASDGGAGDLLTTNGSGSLSWTAGGGGGLGGSGTSGTISKWSTTSTLTDSIMTESGTILTVVNTINATTLGGTLSTVAQGNVTSIGTLTSLNMGGDIDLNTNNIIAGGTAAFTTVTAALSGNSTTATTLQTARDINGVSFDGSANITVTAAAGTLTGTTLKSTVITSSLTSVGTLTSLVVGSGTSHAVDTTLELKSDGTGDATNPKLVFNESDQIADERVWDILYGAGTFLIRARSDNDSSGTTLISAARSGVTIGAVTTGGNWTFSGTVGALDMAGQIDLNTNNIIAGGTAAFTIVTAALSGNASTATILQTARDINGVSFDGSANITVTADANTLTNTTLKSTVVASSLTSVGTLTSLDMGGNIDLNTNNIIAGGTASFTTITATSALIRGSTTSAEIISGGSSSTLGANIVLYGESHASQAHDLEFRANVTVRLWWDHSNLLFKITGKLTVTDLITTKASHGGAGSPFRIPHGIAPTSLTNGDIWTTSSGVFAYVNGSTVQLG